jgi:hypothetical protein
VRARRTRLIKSQRFLFHQGRKGLKRLTKYPATYPESMFDAKCRNRSAETGV